MSNIGKKPIEIKEGVNVLIQEGRIKIKGPKGELEALIPAGIYVEEKEGKLFVKKTDNSRELNKFHGLARSLIYNLVKGVTEGFEKTLELSGVGFRARVEGDNLVLNVGYSHPVYIKAPPGISFSVKENKITVSGIDKTLVGDIAEKIKKTRIPDPYKGKGIKYAGEVLRKKAGKAAKAVGK